jgi:hypothetical protein
VIAATDGGVVVGLQWREPSEASEAHGPAGRELFQVLRLRDGMVVDMEDHVDRRKALLAVSAPG